MPRYIDIDSVGIRKIDRDIFTVPEYADGWNNAIAIFESAPTADVVEVKHGEWIVNAQCNHKASRYKNPEKWVTYKCSECGYSNGRRKTKHCPNCGARMDGQ